jgi:hypothetical protein
MRSTKKPSIHFSRSNAQRCDEDPR